MRTIGIALLLSLACASTGAGAAQLHAYVGTVGDAHEIRVGAHGVDSAHVVVRSPRPFGPAIVSARHELVLYVTHETEPASLVAQSLRTGRRMTIGPVADPAGALSVDGDLVTYRSTLDDLRFRLRENR